MDRPSTLVLVLIGVIAVLAAGLIIETFFLKAQPETVTVIVTKTPASASTTTFSPRKTYTLTQTYTRETNTQMITGTSTTTETQTSTKPKGKTESKVEGGVRFNYWTDLVDGVPYLVVNLSGSGPVDLSLSYPSGKVLDSASVVAPDRVKLAMCVKGRTPIFGRYVLSLKGATSKDYNITFYGPNIYFNTMKLKVSASVSTGITLDSIFAVIDNKGDLPAVAKKLVVEVDGEKHEYTIWLELPVRRPARFSEDLSVGLTPTKHKVRIRLLDQKCTGEWRDLITVMKDYKGPKLLFKEVGLKVEREQSGDVLKWVSLNVENVGDLPVVVDSIRIEYGGNVYELPVQPTVLNPGGEAKLRVDVDRPITLPTVVKVVVSSQGFDIGSAKRKLGP